MPQLQRVATPAFPHARKALHRAQPVLEFIRPYTPDLVGWLRDFGQGAANYDANGHYARIQPMFNAFQLAETPASGDADPAAARRSASTACRTASSRAARARPPSGRPTARRPTRDGGSLGQRLRPEPAPPGPEAPARHRARPRRRRRAGRSPPWARAARAAPTRSARSSTTPASSIPGEDVKVAGVKVGTIDSLDVTPDHKAAVVLEITEPGFQDFRKDASCIDPPAVADRREVRRVHADPAAVGRRSRRRRRSSRSPTAPGKGQYLLPVEHTLASRSTST